MFRSYHRALVTGLLLLAGAAGAQAPPVAPPPPPPPPLSMNPVPPGTPGIQPPTAGPMLPPASVPNAVAIDSQAATVFSQTIAAHQALNSLKLTLTLASTGLGSTDTKQTVTLAYRKPSQAKVAISGSAGPIVQFFTDGKTVTTYIVKSKTYRVQPVPVKAKPIPTIPLVLNQARTRIAHLVAQPEDLNQLLAQPGATATTVEVVGVPTVVSGVVVDMVVVTLPAPNGGKATFTFDIGRADHLLRRITQNATVTNQGKPTPFTETETVTVLTPNPKLMNADFVFTPPAGVTKLTK